MVREFLMTRSQRFLAVTATVLTVVPAVSAEAQGAAAGAAAAAAAAPACDVDQMAPQKLALAMIGRSKTVASKTPDEGMKNVREGMKNILDKQTSQNTLGRDYLMAQYMLLGIEFGGEVQTRGALEMGGDKAAKVDLLVVADSLLDIVEAAKPACKDETKDWREYKPYANRIQAAYTALQANQADSAERSAKRAMILSENAPQAYDVLWRLAASKNDDENQIKYLAIAVDKLGADTSTYKIRANLMFNLGRIQQGLAEKAAADKKAELWKNAAAAYLRVVKEHPNAPEAAFAINGISVRWALTQDSTEAAAVLGIIKPVMSTMDDFALSQAAVVAVRLTRNAEAADLFKAATTANPYSREYLYNYAATLLELKRFSEMLSIASRLVQLDPSNPDNVLLYAYAYKGIGDAATDAAQKKAMSDSAIVYITKSDGMKHKLEFKGLDRGQAATTVDFEIENRDTAAKSYTVEFEFLDKTGAVVEKKSVTVGPVASKAIGTGKVEIAKGGVSGVRYAPLP
jgi:hypothetical protein